MAGWGRRGMVALVLVRGSWVCACVELLSREMWPRQEESFKVAQDEAGRWMPVWLTLERKMGWKRKVSDLNPNWAL